MSRVLRAMPWLCATAAAELLALALITGHLPSPAWRITVVALGLATAAIARAAYRLPLVFVGVVALAAARLAWAAGSTSGVSDVSWTSALADLAVGLALITILGIALWRRYGHMLVRDVVDLLAVTIGSSMVAWLLIANPLIDEYGLSSGLAIVTAAYLPITAVVMTFAFDLTFAGLTRNRTMQLVTVAVTINMIAALLTTLRLVDVIPDGVRPISLALYAAAFLALCAGLVHEDAPAATEPLPVSHELRLDTPARLTLMAISVLAPVALIASISPTSQSDAVVRTLGTMAMVVTVVLRLVLAMRDHASAQQALLRQLHRDELTGLPTRTLFVAHVSELLEKTWRSEHCPTIVQLNLDRFKNINDSLGHYDANLVLVAVSQRLEAAAAAFGGIVARAGGDDFVIVDGGTAGTPDAMERAAVIRESLSSPIAVGDATVFVTASIGVAVAPRNRTTSAEELMRRADIATQRAKADGRNRVALFDDSMQSNLAHRMDVEHALHGAIGREEMVLFHQPIVDIVTGRVSGFEALMRWKRGDGTLVPPLDFIPIAEETGIISELGAWALYDAMRELRGWIDDGVVAPTTTMSVNVSPRQIADPNFVDVVQDGARPERHPAQPALARDDRVDDARRSRPAQTTLRQIRTMGVRMALDDFGTGYLVTVAAPAVPDPAHQDRSRLRPGPRRTGQRPIARAHDHRHGRFDGPRPGRRRCRDDEQLEILREMGCGKAQGYLISRPVPADAMRSTMSALDELASLSLFADGATRTPTRSSAAPRTPEPARPSASGPIGLMSRRPLGQPLY